MVVSDTFKDQNNVNHRNGSRNNKAPVWTSEKRTKFAQRTNKKWVRLATVFGYMIAVSTPAIVLSIYYTCVWHPDYISNFNMSRNANATSQARYTREIRGTNQNIVDVKEYGSLNTGFVPLCQPCQCAASIGAASDGGVPVNKALPEIVTSP